MFTASHNPAQYNGLKLCREGARPVGSETGLAEIRVMAETLGPGGRVFIFVPALSWLYGSFDREIDHGDESIIEPSLQEHEDSCRRQGRGKTPKSSLLHDDTACY